jgi:hypothetical protein
MGNEELTASIGCAIIGTCNMPSGHDVGPVQTSEPDLLLNKFFNWWITYEKLESGRRYR